VISLAAEGGWRTAGFPGWSGGAFAGVVGRWAGGREAEWPRPRLHAARAIMADIFEDPPEFTDLTVVEEWTDAG
jgi:hypothetical protein